MAKQKCFNIERYDIRLDKRKHLQSICRPNSGNFKQMRCGILGPAKRVGGTPNPKFIFVLNPKSAMLDFLDFDFFFW